MEKSFHKNTLGMVLKILSTISLIFYFIFFIGEITPFYSGTLFELMTVFAMFLFFIAGYSFLWKSEKISGIIMVFWYVFLLFFAFFVWPNAGMVIGLGFPVFIIGILLTTKTYFKNIKRLVLRR